jgi:hypothetical protein
MLVQLYDYTSKMITSRKVMGRINSTHNEGYKGVLNFGCKTLTKRRMEDNMDIKRTVIMDVRCVIS